MPRSHSRGIKRWCASDVWRPSDVCLCGGSINQVYYFSSILQARFHKNWY